jgi:hypothetical protein
MNAYVAFPVYEYWLASIAGEAVLVLLLIFRRAYRSNSPFFTFAVFTLLRSLVLLNCALGNATNAYFMVYWLAQPIEAVLLFWVVYGMFRELFQPYESLPPKLLPRFFTVCTIAVALIIATCLLLLSHPQYKLYAAMVAFQRGAAIAVVAVVVLTAAVANLFAVPWRSRLAALAWGMVVYLAGTAIVINVTSFVPGHGQSNVRVEVILSSIVAEILWIAAFARSEAPVPLLDQETVEQLHRLLGMLRGCRRKIGFQDHAPSGLGAECAPYGSTTSRG